MRNLCALALGDGCWVFGPLLIGRWWWLVMAVYSASYYLTDAFKILSNFVHYFLMEAAQFQTVKTPGHMGDAFWCVRSYFIQFRLESQAQVRSRNRLHHHHCNWRLHAFERTKAIEIDFLLSKNYIAFVFVKHRGESQGTDSIATSPHSGQGNSHLEQISIITFRSYNEKKKRIRYGISFLIILNHQIDLIYHGIHYSQYET